MLSVQNLNYSYGEFCVWQDISFELQAGEIVYLVGTNGSGKSTLLRCLAGWTTAKTGSIKLNGSMCIPADPSWRAQISFVPDTPHFYDDLTAQEHIDFILRANRRTDLQDEAARLMENFGLSRFKAQYPSSYSRGMQLKLGIVLALCLHHKVLLLDEPFGPLDAQAASALIHELQATAKNGGSVIISCHQPVVKMMPDRVFYLNDGHLEVGDQALLNSLWPKHD